MNPFSDQPALARHRTALSYVGGEPADHGQSQTLSHHPDPGSRPLGGSIASECTVSPPANGLRTAFIPAPVELLPEVPSAKQRRVDRKMSLIRRSGLFGADTRGAKISRAATLEDLRDAYKLVHRVYLGTGFISEEQAEMRLRIFETSSDTATFVAKKDGRVVGVLSIVQDSRAFGLPSDDAFADELHGLRATGLKLGEITNQAVDEAFRGTAVPTELMRCALAHGIEAGFDLGIAAVSPSHNAFYELLGFRQIGRSRSYSGKIHDPVVPLQIDLAEHRHHGRKMDEVETFMHSFLTAENPYFVYVGSWEKVARERFCDPALLKQLFMVERNFLDECSAEELRALHQHWGDDLFGQVAGALFVQRMEAMVPDLRELDAPRPGAMFLPPRESETSQLREMDSEVACGRCVAEFGLPDADVRKWKAGHDQQDTPPGADQAHRQSLTGHHRDGNALWRKKRLRDLLSVFWRHTAKRTPRAAN